MVQYDFSIVWICRYSTCTTDFNAIYTLPSLPTPSMKLSRLLVSK